MAVDEQDRITRLRRKAEEPAGDAGQAGRRAGQHGHLRVRDQVPHRPAAPRRGRPELDPRLRQGHHSLPRRQRQSGRASFLALLRALANEEAQAYWRDVGTVDAYWEANIDLTDIVPDLDLYDRDWPIWTYGEITPPAKFVHDVDGRRGVAVSSLVSGGCIISGAALSRSLLFTGVRVHSYSTIDEAVILPYAQIGREARLKKVVIDSGVSIPDGLVVGEDPVLDAKRFRRTEGGVT